MVIVINCIHFGHFLQWVRESGLIEKKNNHHVKGEWFPSIIPGYDIVYKSGIKYFDTNKETYDFYIRVISQEAKTLVKLTHTFRNIYDVSLNDIPIYYL